MKPSAPIFDGTAQTDDDGIVGGQGRDDAQLRTCADTILIVVGLLAIVAVVVLSYVGWSFALGLVLAGATWSVR